MKQTTTKNRKEQINNIRYEKYNSSDKEHNV